MGKAGLESGVRLTSEACYLLTSYCRLRERGKTRPSLSSQSLQPHAVLRALIRKMP